MIHKKLFWKKDALVVQDKSLQRLAKEFVFSEIAGQKPAILQKISSITVTFEEFFLKFPEQVIHRIHLSGCFLKLCSQHCLTEILQDCYTFGPASITLDTKSVVKINQHVPIISAAKLKKHKVRIELYSHIFKQDFRQAIGTTKFLEYSFVSSSKTCGF